MMSLNSFSDDYKAPATLWLGRKFANRSSTGQAEEVWCSTKTNKYFKSRQYNRVLLLLFPIVESHCLHYEGWYFYVNRRGDS